MAKNRIKGITITLDADATPLQKALNTVDKALKTTQDNLKDINKLLKLDPGNTELLKQKQQNLNNAIIDTKDRLKVLKDAYKELDGKETSEAKEQQELLAREIAETENKLKSLKKEMSDFGSVAKQKLDAVGDSLKNAGDKMQDIGGNLSRSVTAPIVALGTLGVSFNAQLEQYQVALTTLTGSAEEADRIITNLQEDASKSPFDTKSLIEANQYLISAGVDADKARQDILNLGNAIAATGGGSAELSRMAANLQQIKNTGKATAQDIRQFANAGINIYGLLADATGKTTEEVKDMEVSYELLSDALAKASGEGGKYFGAMENQSQTLTGQLSSLKDEFGALLGDLTKELMPIIKDILGFAKTLIGYLKSLTPEQKKVAQTILMVAAALGPVVLMIGKVISGVGSIIKVVGSMMTPIGAAITIFGLLVAAGVALYKNWDTIKAKGKALLSSISDTFTRIKDTISQKIQSAKDIIANAVEKMKSLLNFHWELPKFKLPHITWTAQPVDPSKWYYKILEVLGLPTSLPKLNVDWYAKAMRNGMILDHPTIFGSMNGQLLGAGEAGSEVVVGTSSLMQMIQQATGSGMTVNMTVNGGNISANELADIVIDKLTTKIQRGNQRW